MKKIKKLLAIFLTAVLLLSAIPMSAFASAPEVLGVEIAVTEVMEEYDGYWEGHYADPDNFEGWVDNSWFCYNTEPASVTVTYADGPVTYNEIWELNNAGHEYEYYAEQTYETQWEVGSTHQAILTLDGELYL